MIKNTSLGRRTPSRLSRRSLLKAALFAAAAGGMSACTRPVPPPAPTSVPPPTPTALPNGSGKAASPAEMGRLTQWMTRSFAGTEGVPFSFVYGGRSSVDLLKNWRFKQESRELDNQRRQRTLSFSDPDSGLVVDCVVTEYTQYPALEWVLHFRNTGASDMPILENVQALDAGLSQGAASAEGGAGDPILYHADGSTAVISDFRPLETGLKRENELRFAPQGGRSSDGVMPFFNLALPDGSGAVVAIGWTGQWAASFNRDKSGRVDMRAGMERTHLKLHPGEEIRTPAILLLFWTGERMRGHNLLRSLLLRHYSPMPENKPAVLPVAASGGYIEFNRVSEDNQLEAIKNIAAHKLPVDTYWIDAGWSLGGFPEGMGTWDPDPDRFPAGLRPVSDAAHKAGLRFLLWFEPERVMPKTWLREKHPEWLLAPADLPAPLAYQRDWRLLNLGNSEALAFAKTTTARMIRDWGIDIYRHDFNMHPLYYWRAGEAEDRQGMNEIRYVEGLYDFFDSLAREFPGILMDNSASGGRRLDFEMLRRLVPLLRSDYFWDPIGDQCHSYGLSFWLPLHGQGAINAEPYAFRSGMGTHMTLAFELFYRSIGYEFGWAELAKRINEYRAIRHQFQGDYYPLSQYSIAPDAWVAWQFDRPDLGEGVILAFRRGGPDQSLTVKPRGLEPDRRYAVTERDSGRTNVSLGSDIMVQGVVVALPQPTSSALITYGRAD